MKHLQTLFAEWGDYSCLAQDYLAAVAFENELPEDAAEVFIAGSLLTSKALGDECYVKDSVTLMKDSWKLYSGEDIYPNVIKKPLTDLSELSTVKWAAVEWSYNGKSHFILHKNGLRFYDSLEDSQCAKYGKPVSVRIIEFK
jgi:hypothetical protein